MSRSVVLTIAGHDPSGGAGITADLRVIEAMGCVGVSAITALTEQNTQGVKSVHLTDPAVLRAQIEALASDIPIAAVKIGMLGGSAQLDVVLALLRRLELPNVVFDPVLASTGGAPLFQGDSLRSLIADLIPLCHLVTPNLSETVRITGMAAFDRATMIAAGRRMVETGARAVLVKGGHVVGDPIDVYIDESGRAIDYVAPRIDTEHTHGTGCYLSAAIAAGLASGMTVTNAITAARASLRKGLIAPVVIGQGRGYPNPLARRDDSGAETLSRLPVPVEPTFAGVYILTDPAIRPDRAPIEIVAAALKGGARIVQYRSKTEPTPYAVRTCRELTRLAHGRGATLIINDRVDIALASGADGVHLGPDDMSPMDARGLGGPAMQIGVSVASVAEATKASPYASYFGVGAVFGSKTKLDAGAPIGLDRLREIKAAFPHVPIVAIGGINRDNIAQVRDTGVEAAAVVSAVVGAEDMETATRELVAIWNDRAR